MERSWVPTEPDGRGVTVREGLDSLAALLSKFETPGFVFGRMVVPEHSLPHFNFSPTASAFVHACYDGGWVHSFDWPEWIESAEYSRLREDPAVLERATPEQLAKLITALVRGERFCDGVPNEAFEAGLPAGICRRAAALAEYLRDRDEE